ncbi:uracil-DNA glycosylase-like [Pempheris klunzingeri]|uniref:uracil-DNA glycosylase-like n=1 Tax=Pempheris klunzingeri TaxID=3127111 RepID=UPI0039806D7E
MNLEWKKILADEFLKPYFLKLADFVEKERVGKTIYPPINLVHSWSNYCSVENIKVVIIGQDPYHGVGQAHGLSFSVNPDIKIPASLRNIYKELAVDIENFEIPNHGFLGGWAKQGVLMLNSCLTVEKSKPNSHQKMGWECLTDAIISHINTDMNNIVFLLWGSNAKEKGSKINTEKHLVLSSAHPSPFSADRGFFGCSHFSTANNYLIKNQKKPIDWCYLPKSV